MTTPREELESLIRARRIVWEAEADDMALLSTVEMAFDVLEVVAELNYLMVPISVELATTVAKRLREVMEARHGYEHGCG